MPNLDETDIRILNELRQNCRQSLETLSSKLGLHPHTVSARIRKLEKNSIIHGYSTHVDYNKIGYPIAQIARIALKATKTYDKDVEGITSIPEVQLVYSLASSYDFFALIRARNADHLIDLTEQMARNRHILLMSPDTVLKTFRDTEEFNPFLEKPAIRAQDRKRVRLDHIDLGILKQLHSNAQKSFSELSRMFGIPVSQVKRRMERMEKENVIRSYRANIDYRKMGYGLHAVVGIRLEKDKLGNKRTIQQLLSLPEIESLYSTMGLYDLNATILCRGQEHACKVLRSISSTAGVNRTDTSVSFEVFKQPHESDLTSKLLKKS